MLLHEDELQNGIIKYDKEDLEGIVFGSRIKRENAELVYETIKKNYNIETINFYEAKEELRKYAIKIEPIKNITEYIGSL